MSNFVIVHHNDADGRCAAAIVLKAMQPAAEDRFLIEADYKDCDSPTWFAPMVNLSRNAEVWIVDFSLPEDLMRGVRHVAKSVTWIDHHRTAKDYTYQDMPGLRDFTERGPAACELTWRYCFDDDSPPRVVTLVGDYDSWRLRHPESSAVRVALEAKPWARDPASDGWRAWLQDDSGAAALVADGYTMLEFRDGYTASLRKSYGFETTFHGLDCYALNVYGLGSQAMGEKMDGHEACLSFVYDGSRFTVGMYSACDYVDCGAICKEHGGGGHKGAAGFQCETLPFSSG